ncbi:MAG: hypothetical protein ABJG68_13445 [Crocinitomicaceae bacterium]
MIKEELIFTGAYSGIFLVLFALGEFLYHKVSVPIEITRKFVHIGTGIICLSFPFFLESHWSVLFLTVSFAVILVLSKKYQLLKSINAVRRATSGAMLFPLVIYLMFWVYSIYGQHNITGQHLEHQEFSRFSLGGTIFYFLPILILSVSDPVAALFGKKWSYGRYSVWGNRKTVVGSSAFFGSAFILSAFFVIPNTINLNCGLLICLCVAAASTALEAISDKGYDNLFIPLSVASVLVIFNQYLLL